MQKICCNDILGGLKKMGQKFIVQNPHPNLYFQSEMHGNKISEIMYFRTAS